MIESLNHWHFWQNSKKKTAITKYLFIITSYQYQESCCYCTIIITTNVISYSTTNFVVIVTTKWLRAVITGVLQNVVTSSQSLQPPPLFIVVVVCSIRSTPVYYILRYSYSYDSNTRLQGGSKQ